MGQVGIPQGRAGNGQHVDRVGLAVMRTLLRAWSISSGAIRTMRSPAAEHISFEPSGKARHSLHRPIGQRPTARGRMPPELPLAAITLSRLVPAEGATDTQASESAHSKIPEILDERIGVRFRVPAAGRASIELSW